MSWRNAESDEERQLLREEMIENAQNYQQLVQTQRNEMLRDLAEQHGITSTARQDEFIQSYQQLQNDPIYNSGMPGGWSGGGYGGGGFVGGRGGR